jgi:mannose/fructose/N-acetylgalactosamine-specific phosphotransferase system component IIB
VSWLLRRVDDRLIHGQVVIAWGQRLRPRRIWVADDAAAGNAWERDLLASAAPDIEVRVVSIAEMAAGYAGERDAAGGAFLLLRGLAAAHALSEAGAALERLNLGGLHYAPGKTKVNEYIYLDANDRRFARDLAMRGVALEVQDTPASRAEPLSALDPESAPA